MSARKHRRSLGAILAVLVPLLLASPLLTSCVDEGDCDRECPDCSGNCGKSSGHSGQHECYVCGERWY